MRDDVISVPQQYVVEMKDENVDVDEGTSGFVFKSTCHRPKEAHTELE